MLSDIWIYKKSAKIFIILLFIAIFALFTQNWQMGLLVFILVAGSFVYIYRQDGKQEKILMKYLDDISEGVTAGTVYAVKNLPIGIAMMDEKRALVWANNVFRSWIGEKAEIGANMQSLIYGAKVSKLWGKTGWFECHAGETFFRVFHKYIQVNDTEEGSTPFMVFYFMDRTDVELLRKSSEESMPVFCMIRIDNISEVTTDMTDVEKSNILSQVNELILKEFSQVDGFIKQYTASDYVACISHKSLNDMMCENFEILDKVRSIHTVNRIPVTLSIGVVKMDEPFIKQAEEAQMALDLALARGGDQAIVKIGQNVKAFGGKVPTSVSSTRVRVRVVAQALKEIIESADHVLVMGHAHEDFDALGSAVGVCHLARASGISANVVLSPQEDTSRKMIDAIRESKELEGLLIDENTAKGMITDKTVLIIVDTHIPAMVAAPQLLEKAKRKVIIDHHRRSASIIDDPLLTYMEPSASSASELVTELIQYYGEEEELYEIEGSCLYAGIVVDTKSFSVQTSVRTFDAASFLRRSGANTMMVREMFRVDMNAILNRSRVLSNLKIIDEYMVFAECPKDIEDSQIMAGQLSDYLVAVEQIKCSFVFYHTEKGLCLSARSDGSINVQIVMESIGGGGHLTVAGAQFGKDGTIEEIENKIIKQVRKQVEEE